MPRSAGGSPASSNAVTKPAFRTAFMGQSGNSRAGRPRSGDGGGWSAGGSPASSNAVTKPAFRAAFMGQSGNWRAGRP